MKASHPPEHNLNHKIYTTKNRPLQSDSIQTQVFISAIQSERGELTLI